jgi:hypothetical protein
MHSHDVFLSIGSASTVYICHASQDKIMDGKRVYRHTPAIHQQQHSCSLFVEDAFTNPPTFHMPMPTLSHRIGCCLKACHLGTGEGIRACMPGFWDDGARITRTLVENDGLSWAQPNIKHFAACWMKGGFADSTASVPWHLAAMMIFVVFSSTAGETTTTNLDADCQFL